MKIIISSDSSWEVGLEWATDQLTTNEFLDYFLEQNYGNGLDRIGVIFMCRDPSLNFKQRINFNKKEKTFYMDIMLNFSTMESATREEREKIVVTCIYDELPGALQTKVIPDFDVPCFIKDFRNRIDAMQLR